MLVILDEIGAVALPGGGLEWFALFAVFGVSVANAHNKKDGLDGDKKYSQVLAGIFSICYINWKRRKNIPILNKDGTGKNIGVEFWVAWAIFSIIYTIIAYAPLLVGKILYDDIRQENAKKALMSMPIKAPPGQLDIGLGDLDKQ